MQIDTGADCTVIPVDVVAKLGLPVTHEGGFRGFAGDDFTMSVVEATVVWERGAFEGKYVVAEASVGLLGRDLLNHFQLDLHGPDLVWTMKR